MAAEQIIIPAQVPGGKETTFIYGVDLASRLIQQSRTSCDNWRTYWQSIQPADRRSPEGNGAHGRILLESGQCEPSYGLLRNGQSENLEGSWRSPCETSCSFSIDSEQASYNVVFNVVSGFGCKWHDGKDGRFSPGLSGWFVG